MLKNPGSTPPPSAPPPVPPPPSTLKGVVEVCKIADNSSMGGAQSEQQLKKHARYLSVPDNCWCGQAFEIRTAVAYVRRDYC